jgi:hypothetical protein
VIVPIALAVAFALGVDARRIVVLAAAIYLPVVVGCLIGCVAWRSRPGEDVRASLFCEGVASEVRAGATLANALATAATSVGSAALSLGASTGSSIAEVAANAAREFPGIGEELRLTVLHASKSGSDVATLFDEIGSLAIAQAELRREVRVATAPGRATALLLVAAPSIYMLSRLGSGGLARMLQSGQQRAAALLGFGLFLAGLAGALLVIWRAGR